MLGQPALIPGDAGGDAESETLFPQERVSSIATAEGHDLPGVGQVRYQHFLWVTGPRVDQGGFEGQGASKGVQATDELHSLSQFVQDGITRARHDSHTDHHVW